MTNASEGFEQRKAAEVKRQNETREGCGLCAVVLLAALALSAVLGIAMSIGS